MTDLQLKGTHEGVKVDPIEKYCQEDLRVSLALIPRPGTFRGFSHLENDNIWAEVTVNLVQAGINFTALELLGAFGGKLEKEVGPGQCRRGKLTLAKGCSEYWCSYVRPPMCWPIWPRRSLCIHCRQHIKAATLLALCV
jgi:hypothetical protein